jgi:outer membrane protein TolC
MNSNRSRRFFAFVNIALFFAAQLSAQDSLTIDHAIDIVMKRNFSIRQGEEALAAAKEHTNGLKSANYPNVNAVISDTYIGPRYPFSFGAEKLNMVPDNAFDAHIGADFTVYDFGKRQKTIEIGAIAEITAADRLAGIKTELTYQVRQLFTSIILQEKSLRVADDGIAELDQHLDVVKKKIETGSATEYDILKTEVQQATSKSLRIDIANDLKKKKSTLCLLLGFTPDVVVPLSGPIDTLQVRGNADSLFRAATANRSDYALLLHAKQSAELTLRSAKLENRPIVGLHASAGFKNGLPNDKMPPDINTPRVNWAAGALFSAPLYDGKRAEQREKEAQRLYGAAQAGIIDKEEHIRTEIMQAMADVEASFSKLDVSRAQVGFAKRSLELARLKYEAGVITNLDVLDAENDFSQAQLGHLQDQFRYVVNLYELDQATGIVLYTK